MQSENDLIVSTVGPNEINPDDSVSTAFWFHLLCIRSDCKNTEEQIKYVASSACPKSISNMNTK